MYNELFISNSVWVELEKLRSERQQPLDEPLMLKSNPIRNWFCGHMHMEYLPRECPVSAIVINLIASFFPCVTGEHVWYSTDYGIYGCRVFLIKQFFCKHWSQQGHPGFSAPLLC